MTNGDHPAPMHGKTGKNKAKLIKLNNDEFIHKVTGSILQTTRQDLMYFNGLPSNIIFHTNKGQVHGPFGAIPQFTFDNQFEASGGKLAGFAASERFASRPPFLSNISFIFRDCH